MRLARQACHRAAESRRALSPVALHNAPLDHEHRCGHVKPLLKFASHFHIAQLRTRERRATRAGSTDPERSLALAAASVPRRSAQLTCKSSSTWFVTMDDSSTGKSGFGADCAAWLQREAQTSGCQPCNRLPQASGRPEQHRKGRRATSSSRPGHERWGTEGAWGASRRQRAEPGRRCPRRASYLAAQALRNGRGRRGRLTGGALAALPLELFFLGAIGSAGARGCCSGGRFLRLPIVVTPRRPRCDAQRPASTTPRRTPDPGCLLCFGSAPSRTSRLQRPLAAGRETSTAAGRAT